MGLSFNQLYYFPREETPRVWACRTWSRLYSSRRTFPAVMPRDLSSSPPIIASPSEARVLSWLERCLVAAWQLMMWDFYFHVTFLKMNISWVTILSQAINLEQCFTDVKFIYVQFLKMNINWVTIPGQGTVQEQCLGAGFGLYDSRIQLACLLVLLNWL